MGFKAGQKIIDKIRGKKIFLNKAMVNGFVFSVEPEEFWPTFSSGYWEPETFAFYKKYVSPDKEIIDIGGWIGPTTLLAYSLNPKKITVVEADPANFQILKLNCKNNYLEDKVDLNCICIGQKSNEIVTFGYTDDANQASSTKSIGGDRVKVKTTSFLDFLKTKKLNDVNIIKIDIEGAEQYIEEGLRHISQFEDINVLLSLHTPFWDNKELTTKTLMKELENFDLYTENEEKISLDKIQEMMLASPNSQWKNKPGLFFTLILKTKIKTH